MLALGKDLGPSPVVRAPLPVGTVNVELRRQAVQKHISVRIVDGRTSARRVDMKESDGVVDPWR